MPLPSGSITRQRPSFSTTRKNPVALSLTSARKLLLVYAGISRFSFTKEAYMKLGAMNEPQNEPVE